MFCSILQMESFAQYLPKPVAPYSIDIGYNKTSNLIFPYAIKSVDKGSTAILAQKASGVENILQIKAGEQNFKETNLTVITTNGQFYSFIVNYSEEPAVINFSFVKDSSEKAIIKNQFITQAAFTAIANDIKSKRHFLHKNVWEQKVKLSLNNMFVKNDLIWLELGITNKSPLAYTPFYVRFFIHDTKTTKRTAVQENELIPLNKNAFNKIDQHASQAIVFAFTPFTIGAAKELVIQVGERDGDRLLTLPISHRISLKIKPL
jgi:conjugative transposon TraN protein